MQKRFKQLFLFLAGALALVVLFVFVLALVKRKTEVDQLVEIMTSGDKADAAWAFQGLGDASEESLDELCRYVSSAKPTNVYLLAWARDGGSSMIWNPQPFSIGEVARYILASHANLSQETEKTVLLKKWKMMRNEGGLPAQPRTSLCRIPEIRPPSQLKEYSLLALSGNVGGLIGLLEGKSKPDAAWAVETLKALPDETLEELIAYAHRREPARVSALASKKGGVTNAKGFTVGQVARFLLWNRMGKWDSCGWKENPGPEEMDRLRRAWTGFRGGTQGEEDKQ